jgi:ribonucleotide reductase alpha subunit
MSFKLSPKFFSQYENKQPNWGFGALSYLVYKRTYARIMDDGTQEEYRDTCKRVTEGVFTAQKNHCKKNGLEWKAHKAQKTAQEFFRRMWDFKFTPPGRGFWIMGTPLVDKVGSAALNNCGFTSTKDVSIELGNSFAWAMDMLMLGVGVGFDTKGAGQAVIKSPRKDPITFVIPDSREGWVESVRLLINSYQSGGNVVIFDYSLIRPRGEPIRGFGGTASGPDPLKELHDNIRKILGDLDGETITSVAIVDIMNFIGKCVVAGNVRRSAELAIGEIDDTDYIEMKDNAKYKKELNDRRWASNNSVFADVCSDFRKIARGIKVNGEPGLIFLDNARHFGRLKDGWLNFEDDRYDNVDGFNPCAEQCLEDKELCTTSSLLNLHTYMPRPLHLFQPTTSALIP